MTIEELWKRYHNLSRTLRAAHEGWCRPGGMTDREIRIMNRTMKALGEVKRQLFLLGEDPYIKPQAEPRNLFTD